MKTAIHQPHYWPWLGYLDKMAKADKFVILDEAQLTERSFMFRNKVLSNMGSEKYLTISYKKEKHLELPFHKIEINKTVSWQEKHKNFIVTNYKKAKHFEEIWQPISVIFDKTYCYVHEVDMDCIFILRDLFQITTPIIYQKDLTYDRNAKKNELVLEICKCLHTDYYLSGNGAKKYMQLEPFEQERIQVRFQDFEHPIYQQIGNKNFQPCMSSLDLLLNEGIERSREIFWETVKKGKEFWES